MPLFRDLETDQTNLSPMETMKTYELERRIQDLEAICTEYARTQEALAATILAIQRRVLHWRPDSNGTEGLS